MKAIVAFSFGRIGNRPNLSSAQIAVMIARRIHQHASAQYVVIAQWEVAQVLKKEGIVCDHIVTMKAEGYLSSRDVAEAAFGYISDKALCLDEVFAAAHPDHVARCVLCLRNAGMERATPLTDESIGYDPNSTEVWVRSRRKFLLREMLAIPLYMLRGEYK